MKAAVVYDSKFGNTEKIARAIAASLAAYGTVELVFVDDLYRLNLAGLDLLVIGGPTHALGLSHTLHSALRALVRRGVKGLAVATFDTRFAIPRFFSGSAAAEAARMLRRAGCRIVAPPRSFLVRAGGGPLATGEEERAAEWAHGLHAPEPEVAGTT